VKAIADVGCSVGVSTFYIAEAFPDTAIIDGMDLSPHFLAVAKHRQQEQLGTNPSLSRIRWLHTNVESTGLPSQIYDIATASFIFHELPQEPTKIIIAELFRLIQPGGVLAITDNNPMSAVIQGLPPAIFTLMKSTEPWSDEYYVFDLESALRDAGFEDVCTVETDPRHRTVLAHKPLKRD